MVSVGDGDDDDGLKLTPCSRVPRKARVAKRSFSEGEPLDLQPRVIYEEPQMHCNGGKCKPTSKDGSCFSWDLCYTLYPASKHIQPKDLSAYPSQWTAMSNGSLQQVRSHLTLDDYLDRPRLRTVRARVEGANRVLEAEPMRHQPLHIQHAALHEADGARPGVGVAVLELEVDFLGAEAHERDLHLWLADADDEDFAAELDGVDLGGIRSVWGRQTMSVMGDRDCARQNEKVGDNRDLTYGGIDGGLDTGAFHCNGQLATCKL